MRPETRSKASHEAIKQERRKRGVGGFVVAMEMALEKRDQAEQDAELDRIFEQYDQEQRMTFFDDVNVYVRENKLMKQWPKEKAQAMKELFHRYKEKKYIELQPERKAA